jgi:hypothetical protein
MLKPGRILFVMVKTGKSDGGKIAYSQEEWHDMIYEYFDIISEEIDLKKAYNPEIDQSQILEIISKK